MKTKTKWLCLLLTVCMAVSGLLLSVQAVPEAEVRYSRDGGATWTNSTLTDAIWNNLMQDNVIIELLKNVTLDDGYGMTCGGPNKTLTIDGKGFTVKRGENTSVFYTIDQAGATVILKDITFDGGAVWNGEDPASRTDATGALGGNCYFFTVSGGASLILEDGAVLQNNNLGNAFYGAAVNLDAGGKLTMKPGAAICNNAAQTGGAVCLDAGASFLMEGGSISGNYAYNGGGAVFAGGSFTMKNGEICGNASGNNGGGVCVSGGSFTLENGKIHENKSNVGGGGVTLLSQGSSALLQGGEISGNTIDGTMGGGILVNNGTLSVKGTAVVSGNKAKENAVSNIYLGEGKTITVAGVLEDGAQMGITMKTPGVFTAGWSAYQAETVKLSDFFSSDNSTYGVWKTAEGEAALHEHQTELRNDRKETCGADGYTGDAVCTLCGEVITSGSKIPAAGAHSFGQWQTVKEATAAEAGLQERVCSVCGAKETAEIPQKADSTQSGDVGSVWMLAVLGGSVLLAGALAGRKRKRAL